MRLHILGGLDLISATGAPARDVTRQTRLMLACLALAGARGLKRAELCALFWPDRPTAQARNSLRQALAAIRRAVSDSRSMSLLSDLETVSLSTKREAIDVHTFREGMLADNRGGWIAAADAYQGELLAGVELTDDLEQFISSHRVSLSDQAQALAERLSKVDAADDEILDTTAALAERLLKSAPASEEAHRALMRVRLRRGHTSAALRQFELCKAALRSELQTEPDVETRELLSSFESRGSNQPPHGAERRAVPSGERPSLAIMPFDNLGDPADEYFADGVVEEITAALSRVRDFFVIARQSTFTFKGRLVDVREVGRELGVAIWLKVQCAAAAIA